MEGIALVGVETYEVSLEEEEEWFPDWCEAVVGDGDAAGGDVGDE